jgi:hypothetical protein
MLWIRIVITNKNLYPDQLLADLLGQFFLRAIENDMTNELSNRLRLISGRIQMASEHEF